MGLDATIIANHVIWALKMLGILEKLPLRNQLGAMVLETEHHNNYYQNHDVEFSLNYNKLLGKRFK